MRGGFYLTLLAGSLIPELSHAVNAIGLNPGLVCAGSVITATGNGYLPRFHCYEGRASQGRYTDSAGVLRAAAAGVPRIDYDPLMHVARGVLAEKASTNELYNSTAFNGGWWNANAGPVFGTTPAPDGGSAVTISNTGTGTSVGVYNFLGASTNTAYTFSGYVKYVSGTGIATVGPDNLGAGVRATLRINTQTGAIIAQDPGVGSASVTNVGNGWYRWVISCVSGSGITQLPVVQYTSGPAVVGFWGIQREQGSLATSYIPTTGSPASRSADTYRAP